MQQVALNVLGMSCRSCVNKIEGNLENINGVESVKVKFTEGIVDVSFNEDIVELGVIKDVIKDSGYEVIQEPIE